MVSNDSQGYTARLLWPAITMAGDVVPYYTVTALVPILK